MGFGGVSRFSKQGRFIRFLSFVFCHIGNRWVWKLHHEGWFVDVQLWIWSSLEVCWILPKFSSDLGAGGKFWGRGFLAAGVVERFELELGSLSYFAQCKKLDRTGHLYHAYTNRLNFGLSSSIIQLGTRRFTDHFFDSFCLAPTTFSIQLCHYSCLVNLFVRASDCWWPCSRSTLSSKLGQLY